MLISLNTPEHLQKCAATPYTCQDALQVQKIKLLERQLNAMRARDAATCDLVTSSLIAFLK